VTPDQIAEAIGAWQRGNQRGGDDQLVALLNSGTVRRDWRDDDTPLEAAEPVVGSST
jgi:hypothetical protein